MTVQRSLKVSEGAARAATSQEFANVARAEVRAAMRIGGLRGWVVAGAVLAVLGGAAAVLLARYVDSSVAELSVVGAGYSTAVLAVGLAASVTRRVSDGTIVVGRLAVRFRHLLMAGQATGSVAVAMAVAMVTAIPFALLAPAVPWVLPSPWWETTAAVVVNVVAAGAVAALVHLAALALRNGALVATAALAVFLIVPVAAGLGALLAPAGLGGALHTIGRLMVGTQLLSATTVPSGGGWAGFVGGWIGVLAWVAAAWLLAWRVSRRPGYGEG